MEITHRARGLRDYPRVISMVSNFTTCSTIVALSRRFTQGQKVRAWAIRGNLFDNHGRVLMEAAFAFQYILGLH